MEYLSIGFHSFGSVSVPMLNYDSPPLFLVTTFADLCIHVSMIMWISLLDVLLGDRFPLLICLSIFYEDSKHIVSDY